MLREMDGYDYYDVLGELAYGLAPRTRGDRVLAFRFKHEEWLSSLPKDTEATIQAIARQFENGGSDSLENPHVFQLPEVIKAGGIAALRLHGKPAEVLMETKARMFAA